MKIQDLLKPASIIINAEVETKEQAIAALIDKHDEAGNLTDKEVYTQGILKRESEGTTAIGEGIAIPHCKSDAVCNPGLAAMTVPGGIDYGAPDGQPSNLVFMIAAPMDGDLHLEVTYTLTNEGELHIDYSARSDADTPFNPTNHSYFNLAGHDSGVSIEEHILKMNASCFTPNDATNLPTGEITPVNGTPFDFTNAKSIGEDINDDDEQLKLCNGYDHNFCLDGEGYREVAALGSEASGVRMVVSTDMPGLQLYTGNGITEEDGKCGFRYQYRMGICMETQFWPDAVNRENFPGGILKAGEHFTSRTTYKFV
jgi:fructose-specific phosphotransferase system IIA component